MQFYVPITIRCKASKNSFVIWPKGITVFAVFDKFVILFVDRTLQCFVQLLRNKNSISIFAQTAKLKYREIFPKKPRN